MIKHLGKREREARKRNKRRNIQFSCHNENGMFDVVTSKLGNRKREKVNSAILKKTGLPF